MRETSYDREAVLAYAEKWALSRNPAYYDFERIGGDCTNFASQCLFAGSMIMNFAPVTGWYYRSAGDRAAAWTGVEYLCRFLLQNKGVGPYAGIVEREKVQPGDLVQLGGEDGVFYHSPVITAVSPRILVAAHSFDALNRPLDSYLFAQARFLHIAGVRKW